MMVSAKITGPRSVSVIYAGTQGPGGAAGAAGIGVPVGGAAGLALVKATTADYDTAWGDVRDHTTLNVINGVL